MQSLRHKIEILAKARGFKTLEAFAKSINYHRSSYSRVLHSGELSGKALQQTAAGLDMSADELLQMLQSDAVIGIDTVLAKNRPPLYVPPEVNAARLERENQVLRDELEEMRKKLVAAQMISAELSEELKKALEKVGASKN